MRNLYVLVLFGLFFGAVACSTSATSPSAPITPSTASKSNTKRQSVKVSTEVRPNDGNTKRQPDEALAELRASDEEWRQSDAKFRKLRRDKTLSENEVDVAEFAEFVATLRRKMLENCQVFRTLGGDPGSQGFDCGLPEGKPSSEKGLPQNPRVVQSEQEKTASLEASLSESLSEFDKTLQEKQGEPQGRLARQGSGGNSLNENVKGEGGKIGLKPGGTGINSGGSSLKSGGKGSGSQLAEASAEPGVKKGGKTNSQVKVVSGGSDDDVVARQLREAAEREQDPVMKEKLWYEYQKYKNSKK